MSTHANSRSFRSAASPDEAALAQAQADAEQEALEAAATALDPEQPLTYVDGHEPLPVDETTNPQPETQSESTPTVSTTENGETLDGLTEPHPHPAPVPLAFELFLAMARKLNLPEARDALGNDMLTTPFGALPSATQALFQVPDKMAAERADQILQSCRLPTPGPATMGGALAHLLSRAGRSLTRAYSALSRLTNDEMAVKRSQWMSQKRNKVADALESLENSVQDLRNHPRHGDLFRRINDQYQDGIRRGKQEECAQARLNLYDEERKPGNEDLYAATSNVNKAFASFNKNLQSATKSGVITQDQSQIIRDRLEVLARSGGVVELGGGQTLQEKVQDMIERFMNAIRGFFQKSAAGPTPGPGTA